MNNADETFDASDTTTFAARSSADRSKSAKKQPRDQFGRWMTVGASVKWRQNDTDYAGTIDSLDNGRAQVSVKSPAKLAGTKSDIDSKDAEVIYSKASIPTDSNSVRDEENNAEKAVNSPQFQAALNSTGEATSERADGYSIQARKDKDDTGNPIMYQLYAPKGRSLGMYTMEAIAEFEAMIATDKAEHEDTPEVAEDSAPTGDTEAPVMASASVVRIARDNSAVIVFENNKFKILDKSTQEFIQESSELRSLVSSGSWRRAIADETQLSNHILEFEDIEIETKEAAKFRVPQSVKESVISALSTNEINIDENDLKYANSLAYDDAVSLDAVSWINNFFTEYDLSQNIRGGYKGNKWASKILADEEDIDDIDEPLDTEYNVFDDETFLYIGVGTVPGSTSINELYCVDDETGAVYKWEDHGFTELENISIEDIDYPSIIILDQDTAQTVAKWIDVAAGTPVLEVLDTDPEERNLFTLALPELDFEELDRSFAIIADATGYSPVERSINAQRQKRGPGGKFGGSQIEQGKTLSTAFKKATLPNALPLITDINGTINDWLLQAADLGDGPVPAIVAAGDPVTEEVPAATAEEDPATSENSTPNNDILYFAIVDPVDQTAVLDTVALTKSNGAPVAWLRSGGTWVKSDEKLADLQGATPPPVVKLDIPEPAKTVLAQIDSYDSEKQIDTTETPISASIFALFDGSFQIIDDTDLFAAVVASANINQESDYGVQVKNHIRKRARALNRMDIIPESWRKPTLPEIGIVEATTSPLYGEFGEVITAGGIPGIADTPGDFAAARRLKNYWTRGRGALKIRWGTPGDLTRAHRHLAKYVGPHRAWGLAQNYHKSLFGVSNITHDKATGQYRKHRRGKH